MKDFDPDKRFMVVAVLYSIEHKRRIRLKTYVPEDDCRCPSLTGIFDGAHITEREAYDMFGIRFDGHPNLKRLLTPEYMKYHPLRKDYPVTGRGERDNFPQYEEIQ
ncbi:MAG: NADH-quinone oxidoreductase subunit C, partial [Planctomycetes bacterium]|nr:NADH-quinone oxidoreductase subunit C [Planctomycetota bacterium]